MEEEQNPETKIGPNHSVVLPPGAIRDDPAIISAATVARAFGFEAVAPV